MAEAAASVPFRRVAIVGLGVMGGSVARGLAALPAPPRRTGWSPDEEERRAALAAGALDAVAPSWQDAVEDADLVVVAAPLSATCDLMAPLGHRADPACVLTDVASLKEPVREAAVRAGLAGRWVGSHPMCGSEASGFGASRADLFAGARVWTVVTPEVEDGVERTVAALWRALGAEPLGTEAAEHDRIMARLSHLPQLASNALARTLREGGIAAGELGPGGRDATRLAASSPEMWRDLLAHARPELVAALRSLEGHVGTLVDLLEAGDVDSIADWMEGDRRWRGDS